MKNKKLIIIIILLIILGSIYPIYYIIKKNQKIENKIYYYELKNNSLTLLANGKIVNFYNCDNECTVYENYFDNGKILLQENNKIYLYDLVKGSKLSSDYENVYFIKDENEKVNYLLVKNGQYYGIINMSGSVTVNLNYKELGKIDGVNVMNLNVKEDYITALSDNKYGLISLIKFGKAPVCNLAASSGTTPPYLLCSSSWVIFLWYMRLKFRSKSATELSSQLLSIPKIT